jgi:hypothetical protein
MDVSRSTDISSKLKNNIVKFYNKFKNMNIHIKSRT